MPSPSPKEESLICLAATAGDDKPAAPLGMPGETWMIPVSGIIAGAIVGVLLLVANRPILAVVAGVGLSAGIFVFSIWAWKDRSPRWFDCWLKTRWYGPHAEISGVIGRRQAALRQHPYKLL